MKNTKSEDEMLELSAGASIFKCANIEGALTVLTDEASRLLCKMHRRFNSQRIELLKKRVERQAQYDAGQVPQYLEPSSPAISENWKIAPIPEDLRTRRVEITGPVNSAKMVINMLSRGADGARADCAMLDFEDSLKPSWENVISGIQNVIGVSRGVLEYLETEADGSKKIYRLNPEDMALPMVRARGLHLLESNFLVDGEPISGGLFDLTLCVFHTAKNFISCGKTPKYYIPKVEHFLEARWWNDVFSALEDELLLKRGALRVTFLIETLPAAFQMEEILYEVREHAVALNGGRWDKIFSDIKTLKLHKDRVLADRSYIDMERPWMKNYILRLIEICHRRGAFAMGGMAAFTPGKDPKTRATQVAKVRSDKKTEARRGHDGCWVSHPYFIAPAMEEFKERDQLHKIPQSLEKYPMLLPSPEGPKTILGLRKNIRVGIAYLHGWRKNLGCIAWDNLMEDLATLEISRAQVWQWLYHRVHLDDGVEVNRQLVEKIFEEELEQIIAELHLNPLESSEWISAKETACKLFLAEKFQDFLSEASERCCSFQ